MIAPELENVYGNGPHDGKFMKLSATFTSKESQSVSVLGIIVSSTLPKHCGARASHKFCCSFFIIDPFYHAPTAPVCVNLFMNNPKNFLPAYTIGDVIYCQNMKLQKYRDFPQLVGNFEKSTIFIFRNKKQMIINRKNTDEPNDQALQMMQPEEWEIHNYTAARATLANIEAPLSQAIIHLSNWAHDFFKSQSMADAATFPHYNLHSLLYHYNIFHRQSERYQAIFPPNMQIVPAPSLMGSVGPEIAKLDVVGLVVSNTKGTGNIPTRILLWDGTGNGYYPSIPGVARHIATIDRAMQSAADAAEIWQQFIQRGKALGFASENAGNNDSSSSNTVSTALSGTTPWDKDLFLGSFFVVESHDLPGQTLHQEFLTNFQPGKWIRLRNITISNQRTDFGVPVGEVRADAHVSFLQPYFRDVRMLISDYFVRIHRHLSILEHQKKQQQLQIQQQQQQIQQQIQRQQQQQQQQQVVSTATTSTSSTSAGRQRQVSKKGHVQTLFAWIMALPSPPANKLVVEFFCAGCVVNWYPQDTSKFVQTITKDDGTVSHRFLFSLRLFDFSETVQVIFSGKEATKLLRVSPEEYATNATYARTLEEKLTQMKESQAMIHTYIRLYTKLLSVPIRKPSRGPTPHAKKRLVKRIMGFDAMAPFQLLSLPTSSESTSSSSPQLLES